MIGPPRIQLLKLMNRPLPRKTARFVIICCQQFWAACLSQSGRLARLIGDGGSAAVARSAVGSCKKEQTWNVVLGVCLAMDLPVEGEASMERASATFTPIAVPGLPPLFVSSSVADTGCADFINSCQRACPASAASSLCYSVPFVRDDANNFYASCTCIVSGSKNDGPSMSDPTVKVLESGFTLLVTPQPDLQQIAPGVQNASVLPGLPGFLGIWRYDLEGNGDDGYEERGALGGGWRTLFGLGVLAFWGLLGLFVWAASTKSARDRGRMVGPRNQNAPRIIVVDVSSP
ncbi:hypothetical protein DFJ73DRAFT_852619 [Zopfochytrium polystomum]|nr:hypothetical protein DFJ73DRAFT_852619 [Zopfochytrium polystomum]